MIKEIKKWLTWLDENETKDILDIFNEILNADLKEK